VGPFLHETAQHESSIGAPSALPEPQLAFSSYPFSQGGQARLNEFTAKFTAKVEENNSPVVMKILIITLSLKDYEQNGVMPMVNMLGVKVTMPKLNHKGMQFKQCLVARY